MLDIIAIVFPLFALMGLGFIAFKTQLVKAEGLSSIGHLVLYFTLPATVFVSVSRIQLSEAIEPYFIAAYALGSLGLFALGFGLRFWGFGNTLTFSALSGLGMTVPNSIFIGFPLLVLFFPDNPPTIAFVMAVLVENILIIPLALILLETGASHGQVSGRQLLRLIGLRLIKNPLIIAIAAGVIAALIQLPIPKPLAQTLDLVTRMSAGLALMFIGMTLASTPFKGNSEGLSSVVIGKLIGHPLLCAGALWLLPDFDPVLEKALIIIAAVPMLAVYPILGDRYGLRGFCANTLFVTSVMAFFTLVIVLRLLQSS